VRPELDAVMDFYRGLLSRLPDPEGFAFWVARFRAAQCAGASAVTGEAESISSLFATSGEYLGRNRTNAQFVGDLYNAFLRRGGDLGGVQFWIGELNSNARTRENVRQNFRQSPEFGNKVNAIINAGCQS
jgi:serralysin